MSRGSRIAGGCAEARRRSGDGRRRAVVLRVLRLARLGPITVRHRARHRRRKGRTSETDAHEYEREWSTHVDLPRKLAIAARPTKSKDRAPRSSTTSRRYGDKSGMA